MTPSMRPRLLTVFVCFLFTCIQVTANADDTPFTILFKRQQLHGATERQTLPTMHEGQPENSYVVGPIPMHDGSSYTLELSPNGNNNGVVTYLRQAPKGGPSSIEAIKEKDIIGGVNLVLRDAKYYYQMLDAAQNPDGGEQKIPIPDGVQPNNIVHIRQDYSAVAMPDLHAVLNLIMEYRLNKETELEDPLAVALSKLSISPPPHECLLNFVHQGDTDIGFVQKDQWTLLPVHSLNGPLKSHVKLDAITTAGSLLNRNPPVVSVHSQQVTYPGAIISTPFFVEGLGDTLIMNGKSTIHGSHYFFQIYKEDGGMTISLRRLRHASVEESAIKPVEAWDALSLHVSQDNRTVTLNDGKGQELARKNLDTVFSKQNVRNSFKGKVDSINHVMLVNLMSRWVQALHPPKPPQQPPLPPLTYEMMTDKDIKACFNSQESPVQKLNNKIFFDYLPTVMDLNIGFQDSHIHTKMMLHLSNPASGFETGGIVLTVPSTDEPKPFSFVVRSHTPQSFEVAIHSLKKWKSPKDHAIEQATTLLHGKSDAIATLRVTFIDQNKMVVSIENQHGEVLYNKTLADVDWSTSKDVISVLPLPQKGREEKRVNLPGLATCINILSHATTGDLDAAVDEAQLYTLYHRQTSMDVTHPKGAYYSDVKRDFTTVTPYRTGRMWRNTMYGVKLIGFPALWAWNHPRTTAVGVATIAGLAGAATMLPESTRQLLKTATTVYGSAIVDTLDPRPYFRPKTSAIETVHKPDSSSTDTTPPSHSNSLKTGP